MHIRFLAKKDILLTGSLFFYVKIPELSYKFLQKYENNSFL